MSAFSFLLGILFALVLVAMLLYIVFGQLTVRKLRNTPEAKQILGIEFISGWDIINVAQALSMPKWFVRKLKDNQLNTMFADAELLYEHTTKLDRLLAKVLYWLLLFSSAATIFLIILEKLGLFKTIN